MNTTADTNFCPTPPIMNIPLVAELFASTEDQAIIKNVNRAHNHMEFCYDNDMRKQLMMEGYITG